MIKEAKKRGYVTVDELNSVLPSEEVTSEQIEDTMAMLSDMGINVVESDEQDEAEPEPPGRGAGGGAGGPRADGVRPAPPSPRRRQGREPSDRTDDPVRMYLREMGSVELLSREGEIAIAKRIEAGREAMIAGPLRNPAHLPGDHHLARRAERRPTCCCATSSTWRRPMPARTPRSRTSVDAVRRRPRR